LLLPLKDIARYHYGSDAHCPQQRKPLPYTPLIISLR